jgi:type I restriction enzyme R subunit
VALEAIEVQAAGSLERLQRIEDATNALLSPDPLRRDFFGHEPLVGTLQRAVTPDPATPGSRSTATPTAKCSRPRSAPGWIR